MEEEEMIYREDQMERLLQQTAEMSAACDFLYHMRNHDPVIAGGALWSWAAGRRPNDIDVFVANSPGLVEALEVGFEKNSAGSDSLEDNARVESDFYRAFDPGDTRPYVIQRFKHRVVINFERQEAGGMYAIPVDLVVTPWRRGAVISHFDYNHCRVAFGIRLDRSKGGEEIITIHADNTGADWYMRGQLETAHPRPREESRIRSKLQSSLWGNQEAGERLRMVFEALDTTMKSVFRAKQAVGNTAVLA